MVERFASETATSADPPVGGVCAVATRPLWYQTAVRATAKIATAGIKNLM
jgi:hypothetical protein